MPVNETVSAVTEKIIERSKSPRRRYLDKIDAAVANTPKRKALGCANIAHGFAACTAQDKNALRNGAGPTSASSPPITTCSRRTSPSRPIPN
jgi:phosphogluconate dehydratase